MRGIWVFNIKKIKQGLLILIAAFFAAIIAFVQTEHISVSSTPKGPMAISKVKTEKKQLALTFDISWGDIRAEPIIDYLKKENIKATFFVTGEWAETHKDIMQKLNKEGFEIGSHGMKYESYPDRKPSDVRKDMILASAAIKKASGKKPTFIRPPNGAINKDVLSVASKLHQQVVLWSVDSQDWTNPGSDKIIEKVINRSGKGDIILLHASDSAKQTLKALPTIINELENKGYSFVTLSKLVSNSTVKNKLIN